jgi:hypothetical protein
MTHEVGGEPYDLEALHAAVDEVVEPPGQLEWDRYAVATGSALAQRPAAGRRRVEDVGLVRRHARAGGKLVPPRRWLAPALPGHSDPTQVGGVKPVDVV